MDNLLVNKNQELSSDNELSLLTLGNLTRYSNRTLTQDTRIKIVAEYKAGATFVLDDGTTVEVIMDAAPSDVFYSVKDEKIYIYLLIRKEDTSYQNVNMHLLKNGTCAKDKYNQFPGVQHYTKDERDTICKIPNIAKHVCEGIKLTVADFKEGIVY